MIKDLDVSLAIRIIRDVYNRCGFAALTGVYAEKKEDSSLVTDIDPLVEHIILEHLAKTSIGKDDLFSCVREEAKDTSATIRTIKTKPYLVTIDGIDGTGDFVRHFNRCEPNSKWLVGLTAIYQRDDNGLYTPVFAFALQPNEDRMFVAADGKALLIKNPLRMPSTFHLNAVNDPDAPDFASIDVFLDKPKAKCKWQLSDESMRLQSGPSGFNTASLAASAAPFEAFAGSDKITFTTFHYKLWDLGLWPVLNAAGIQTVLKGTDALQLVSKLDLNWFGPDEKVPGLCDATPIILSKKGVTFDPLVEKADRDQ